MRRVLSSLFAIAVVCAAAPAVAQGDDPTEAELARIEEVLRAEGYSEWDDIERDGDLWEVEEAVGADGEEYELKLDRNFAVVEREED